MFDLRETNERLDRVTTVLAQLGAVADETLSVLRDIRELLTEPEDAP